MTDNILSLEQYLKEFKYYEENIDFETTDLLLKTIKSLLAEDPMVKDKADSKVTTLFDDILELERRDNLPADLINNFINWVNKLYEYKTPFSWFIPNQFHNLTEFFTRRIVPEKLEDCRKMSSSAIVCSPGEANLVSTGFTNNKIYIKNIYANLTDGLKEIGLKLEDYIFINFKLLRSYYHRAHSPVDGKITKIYQYPSFSTDFFGKNSASGLEIETDFGKVYMFAIGELNVQAFTLVVKKGDTIKKCDDIGYFTYGSQILLLMPKDAEGTNNMSIGRPYFVGAPLIIK